MGTSDSQIGSFALSDDVVLAQSDFGRDELQRPRAGLSLPQRKLLSLLDGARSLRGIAKGEPTLRGERLTRDAARLLALGLAQLDAELLPPNTRVPTSVPQSTIGRTAAPPVERRPPQRVAAPRRSGSMLWIGAGALGSIAVGLGFLFWPAPQPAPRIATTAAVPSPISSAPAAPVAAVAAPTMPVAPPNAREKAAVVTTAPAPAAAPPRPLEDARVPAARTAEETRAAVASAPPAAVDGARKPAPAVEPAAASAITPPRVTTSPGAAVPVAQGNALQPAPPPVLTAAQSLATPPAAASATPAAIAPAAAPTAATQAPVQVTAPAAATTALAIAPQAREFAPVESDAARAASAGALVPVLRIPPVYPRDAVREGITRGSVRARAILAANGSVERVEFPATDERNRVFERPARSALLLWTFAPGERGRVYEVVLDFVAP